MIFVQLNKENFEYDIHSLVKAFYPSEDVSVCACEKEATEPICLWLGVEYREHSVAFALKEPGLWQTVKEAECRVDFTDRREAKNQLKRGLYRLLVEYTGKTLPWGTLTGIRPTKIPMAMLEQGRTDAEIEAYMARTYQTSKEKIALSIEIAKRERELLKQIHYDRGFSLYIGIPFCPTTCSYCSFTSFPLTAWEGRVDSYLDALEKEIAFAAEYFSGQYLNTVYIGGGTPTTLTPGQSDRLLSFIEASFDFSHLLEFTVEAGRPDSITKEKLEVLRTHGITRLSINPQTMKQETLDIIGRRHTVAQTQESFYLARSLGFDNINMDLIMGLPQEELSDVCQTMEALRELGPDNVTVHSLAIKRAAKLAMQKEDYAAYKMVNTQAHLDAAARVCKEMGMEPYYLYRQKNMAGNFENIGYAKEGKQGIYNILIMEEVQTIVALGAGSISKRVYDGRIKRCENVKDVALYIEKIDQMIERKRKLFEDI